MPPSKAFTRDQVIDAAFELVRRKGLSALSARNVAKKLKTSTSPIYGYFRKMDLVKHEIIVRAMLLLHEYQVKPRSDDAFYDMGLGYIEFARKEKNLFFEVLAGDLTSEFEDAAGTQLDQLAVMKKNRDLAGLTDSELERLLLKMWIFVHGLASLMQSNRLDGLSDKQIATILYEVGTAVIGDTLRQAKRPAGKDSAA